MVNNLWSRGVFSPIFIIYWLIPKAITREFNSLLGNNLWSRGVSFFCQYSFFFLNPKAKMRDFNSFSINLFANIHTFLNSFFPQYSSFFKKKYPKAKIRDSNSFLTHFFRQYSYLFFRIIRLKRGILIKKRKYLAFFWQIFDNIQF